MLILNDAGTAKAIMYTEGSTNKALEMVDNRAIGMTVQGAVTAGYCERIDSEIQAEETVNYSTVSGLTIQNATMSRS